MKKVIYRDIKSLTNFVSIELFCEIRKSANSRLIDNLEIQFFSKMLFFTE